MLIFAFREYGAIDDVDIDLHIDVSFLDVSINFGNRTGTLKVRLFLVVLQRYHIDYKLIYAEILSLVKGEIIYKGIFGIDFFIIF